MRGPGVAARWARVRSRGRAAATPLNVAACLLALVPAVRMTAWVIGGLPVHFSDYWLIFDGLVNESGSPSVRDIVEPYNGHLMVVPKILYWLNAVAFDGSNIALGLVVVLLALTQVILLWTMAPRGRRVHPLCTAVVLAATGALLFAPHGAWSFLRSMSGAAWLTANTFAVAAVVVRARGWRTASHVLAVLAAMSYGTGIVALGAVLVIAVVEERKVPVRDWPAAVMGVAVVAWYQWTDVDPVGEAPPGAEGDLASILNGALRLVGSLSPTPRAAAAYVGFVVLAVGAGVALWAVSHRRTPGPGWVGLMAYGVGCTFTIAWGRHFLTDFNDSRYASIAAMVWLPTIALVAMLPVERIRLPRWSLAVPLALIAGAVAVGGTAPVRDAQATRLVQTELGNAFRVDVADGGTPWLGFSLPMPPVTDRLRTLGHHPFTSRYTGDCGLLDRQVDADLLVDPGPDDPTGGISLVERGTAAIPRAVVLTAFADVTEGDLDCVVVIDGDRRVVGVGTFGWNRPLLDGTRAQNGIRALAPVDAADVAVYIRLEGDPRLIRIPDPRNLLDPPR